MSLIVDEHRAYLSDTVRLDAFRRAIEVTVRPGDVVVDLGSGTGVLGLFALRAGARHVYSIENSGMIEVGRAIARTNGVADRVTFIARHSTEVQLPEPADVLVADLVGAMGFEIGMFGTYADARRFMKPGGRMIPRTVTMAIAPVEDAERFAEVQFWATGCAGIDTRDVLRWAVNTGYPRRIDRQALLSADAVRTAVDSCSDSPLLRIRGDVAIVRAGIMHGIAGWFEADMADGVTLSNSPLTDDRLTRRNVFFPLERAVAVAAGDRASLHVRVRPADFVVSWDAEIHTATGVERERHSTLGGMLLTPAEIESSTPASIPRLTPRGVARQTVLELCDGRRSLGDIEREVRERHAALFVSAGEAQAFVAEVVSRYTEPVP